MSLLQLYEALPDLLGQRIKDLNEEFINYNEVICRDIDPTHVPFLYGLNNLGNTCYMNSIIQCIINIKRVHVQLLDTKARFNQIIKNPEFILFYNFVEIIYQNFDPTYSTQLISYIMKIFVDSFYSSFGSRFTRNAQEDASEFLLVLLNYIDNVYSEIDLIVNFNTNEQLNVIEKNIFLSCFNIEIESCCTCLKNEHDSKHELLSPWLELTIKNQTNLVSCLDKYFALEELCDEQNQYYCNACKKHVMATKLFKIKKLPKTIIIYLKRFETNVSSSRSLIHIAINYKTLKIFFLNKGIHTRIIEAH